MSHVFEPLGSDMLQLRGFLQNSCDSLGECMKTRHPKTTLVLEWKQCIW